MSFLRSFRSGLVLLSLLALGGTALGIGCAQAAVPPAGGNGGSGGTAPVGHCKGTPPQCGGLGDFECQTTNGCTFTGQCAGTAADCSLLAQAGCILQGGCTWSAVFSECQGTPTACTTFTGQDDCNKEIGCAWASQCSGTPIACEGLSDKDCRYQRGCTCEGCDTTTSSSSGGNPVCLHQSDCDPTVDPCKTGDCINGECIRIPNCKPCAKQIECDPGTDPCFTGNCVDGMCQAVANCLPCASANDCTVGVNKCFTGNCVDGSCETKTTCTSGDGCCPAGCAGVDSDCH